MTTDKEEQDSKNKQAKGKKSAVVAGKVAAKRSVKVAKPSNSSEKGDGVAVKVDDSLQEEAAKKLSVKTYILDTNVLLSDGNVLSAFDEHNIVIPYIVLEEMDRHKDRPDEVGRNAREFVRKLKAISTDIKDMRHWFSRGPKLGMMKIISIGDIEGWDVNKRSLPIELQSHHTGDNTILEFCMAYSANEECILVSRDTVLRIKCKTVGIPCEDYRKLNVVASASSLYSGILECDDLDVQELYSMNGQEAAAVLPESVVNSLKPNEFLSVRNGQSSYLARFTAANRPLKPVSGDYGSSSKIKPRNREQRLAYDLLYDENVKLVTLTGKAGSGKSIQSLDCGLEQVINKRKYSSLVICRPVMPVGKDIGFLPGGINEKMEPWMAPIKDNLRFILNAGSSGSDEKPSTSKKKRASAGSGFGGEDEARMSDKGHLESILQSYFDEGIIEIQPLTYIRGRSISNAFIIVDEAQNTSLHEIKTILTRAGEGTKIVLTGDIEQIDRNDVDSVSNGLTTVVEKFKDSPIAGHVSLVKGERSQLATIAAEILG